MSRKAELLSALASYIGTLQHSYATAARAEDRPRYREHLSRAALMFHAIQTDNPPVLKAMLTQELGSFGWVYLAGDAGAAAERAFAEFRAAASKAG